MTIIYSPIPTAPYSLSCKLHGDNDFSYSVKKFLEPPCPDHVKVESQGVLWDRVKGGQRAQKSRFKTEDNSKLVFKTT